MKTKFMNRSYVENRQKLDLYPFSPDSLPKIPYTNKLWTIQVRDSLTLGDKTGPALRIEGVLPYTELEGTTKWIKMFFGDLNSFDLEGSWEQE
jgi:hypothetical protein